MFSILLVDDDSLFRRLVIRMLRGIQNLSCIEASSVAEATALLQKHKPTILLTDLQLGDGAGVELLETLSTLSWKTLPILMSGVASPRDYQSALRLGVVDVLIKPFTREELLLALQRALDSVTGFRGVVHGLLLTDLLQMFHLASRSLVLEIRGPSSSGGVAFMKGDLVHAWMGEQQGLLALQGLVSLPSGTIHSYPARPTPHTIEGSFQEVLMDAFRVMDERQREIPLARLSSAPPMSTLEISPASQLLSLGSFLVELDPNLGFGTLDGRTRGPAAVHDTGGLAAQDWDRIFDQARTLINASRLSWFQIQWFWGNTGMALLRTPVPDHFIVVAQLFSSKLDDRRFRWNVSRIEKFFREEGVEKILP
ncbi:MAG: response regulator [Polyangiaceae bacterium]|nr:response regulator [Polyangiaceae bacterium]